MSIMAVFGKYMSMIDVFCFDDHHNQPLLIIDIDL